MRALLACAQEADRGGGGPESCAHDGCSRRGSRRLRLVTFGVAAQVFGRAVRDRNRWAVSQRHDRSGYTPGAELENTYEGSQLTL